LGKECEGVSRKWGRSVSGSAGSRVVLWGGQQEMRQECENVSRKWGRSAGGQQEVGQECEMFSNKWGSSVRGSVGRGAGV